MKSLLQLMSRLGGIVLMSFCIFSVVSIATFDLHDPTILNVNHNQITNWGGELGATFADVTTQAIGYGFLYPLIFMIILSIRMILVMTLNYFVIRTSLLLFILPLVCGAIEMITQYFKIPKHYAGFIGDYIAIEVNYLTSIHWVQLTLLVLTILSLIFSLGLKLSEWYTLLKWVLSVSLTFVVFLCRAILMLTKIFYSFCTRGYRKDKAVDQVSQASNFDMKSIQNAKQFWNKSENQSQAKKARATLDQTKKRSVSNMPSVDLLSTIQHVVKTNFDKEILESKGNMLVEVLADFGVSAELKDISPGPVVTLYEFEPSAGTKSSRVIGLADDIARSMKSEAARIAVIPGKNAIGIELPNLKRETVYLREMLESEEYLKSQAQLPLILGKTIGGAPVIADLTKMPHVLVAGTTGSGKSVAINTMILSLIYKHPPETCKFVMIDPKMLELSVYNGIPHLLAPVVTDSKKAVTALKWVVREMEERYRAMSILGVRNIGGYNKALFEAMQVGEVLTRSVQTGFDKHSGKPIFEKIGLENKVLPYLVVVVDEMADLMLVAGKDIEAYIQRLAQMARAAGIHIIMATQRPSVDVITGVIKANFPTRISFQVSSKIDSRTVLGEQGAEQLLGMGDMLYMMPGGKIERIHGPFVSDREVENVVNYWKEQGVPEYVEDITTSDDSEKEIHDNEEEANDDLYEQALEIVKRDRKVSTSYLQRCLRIGYNRAANIVERMEKDGVVSAPNHGGKRELLN